jgi:hypothetical protein
VVIISDQFSLKFDYFLLINERSSIIEIFIYPIKSAKSKSFLKY